ncbi:hypothetical protein BDZ94DRAFT_1356192, partial [Collybia nuda]
ESVVRFQGILCDKQLPPITKTGEATLRKQKRHIRQAVTITGLSTPTFQQGIDNIAYLYMMFSNQFPDGKMEIWQPSSFNGHVALDAHARYLTERRLAPQEQHIEYAIGVDPHGALADLQGHDFIHGPDNYVEYLAMQHISLTRYSPTNPINFRVGDIVEVQLAFMAVPIKDQRYKMLVSLRGITLLDDSHRNVSTNHYTRL